MQGPNEVLEKYDLALLRVIQEFNNKAVWHVKMRDGREAVLKWYANPDRGFQVEKAFLSNQQSHPGLKLPEVYILGEDFMVIEFVPREHLSRDTVLEREWSEADVMRWVRGLGAFQRLTIPEHIYSMRQKVMGFVFPVVRCFLLIAEWPRVMSPIQWCRTFGWCLGYLLARAGSRSVLTHYDLQTMNYTFSTDGQGMSMVDFEFPYYRGDQLYDLIYYITIPIQRVEDWTFQRRIWELFLEQQEVDPSGVNGLRIRLMFLVCFMQRYRFLANDPVACSVYRSNIQRLFGSRDLGAFLHAPAAEGKHSGG